MKELIFVLLVSTHLSVGCNIWNTQCMTALSNREAPATIKYFEEVGDSSFDPIECNSVQIHEQGLHLFTENVKIFGLSNYVVDLLSFDRFAKNMGHKIIHTDLYITGHYRCNGTVFSFPTYGDGDFRILLKNIELEMTMRMNNMSDSDGVIYDGIKDYQVRYEVKDNAAIQFDNLYSGDKESSDRMHYIANTYWKLVTSVYGKKYIDLIADTFIKAVRVYLKRSPLTENFT